MTPDDDQEMVFPCTSVMVIMVLLKEAFTWATPEVIFLRSLRRTRVVSVLANFRPLVRYQRRRNTSGYIRGSRKPAIGNRSTACCRLPIAVLFLLTGDCLGRAFAGARIGMRALTADRQAT